VIPRPRVRQGRGRRLWAAALALPLAIGIATTAEGAGEEVTLRFAWWGGDSRHAYTQELIDMYVADHPNVSIEPEFVDFEDYWNRLATESAAGDTPDVLQQDLRYLADYANRGILADLGPYLGDQIADTALDETIMTTGLVEDTQYGIPTGVNAFGIVIDPVLFEEAAVEIPDDTSWTWDDFTGVGAQITEASGGDVYGIQDGGFNETSLEIYLRQNGEALYTEDGTALGFTPERMAEWWQFSIDQRDSGAMPPASVTVEVQNAGIDQSLLATNTGAMGFWWSNQLGALAEGAGRDLQILRFPGGSEGMYLKSAMLWSMSAETEHPEEAAAFIDFLINDERAAELMLVDRGVPTNLEMREAIAEGLDANNQLAIEFVDQIGSEAAPPPGVPPQGAGEVQEILQRLNEQVLFDQMSVDEAVEAFMSEASTAIGA
jgi:pectin-derived oligosaccharide transport system substrate-binding protein